MAKKYKAAIDFDQQGNITLGGGDYGANYRTFSNDEAIKRSQALHQQTVQRRTAEAARKRLEQQKLAKLQKEQEEKRLKDIAAKKKLQEEAAQRYADQIREKAQNNVAVTKYNNLTEAGKRKKQAEQEATWYKGLAATAANLTLQVPGIMSVIGLASSAAKSTKGLIQHIGGGKIGEFDSTDIQIDPLTKIKTISDGNGGRRAITPEEYQDVLYKDQKQYGEDQKDKSYNLGAIGGTALNTGAAVGGAMAPTVLRAAEGIFDGITNLIRDSADGSDTAGSDFITKMKLTGKNFEAGLAGADVALSTGLDKLFDTDGTEKRLADHKKYFDEVSEEGTALQREYSDNRAPYIERDKREEAEGDPLLRQKQLDSWEAGLIEEPEWHKKKEGVFSNTLGYMAKNPGRIFKYLADGADDILREGLTDKGEINSDVIRAYQDYNDIKSKSLFGKELKTKDVEDFKKNSQQTTFLTETGETVSIPRNRVDPKTLEEDSQASPDYMNIQEVETDDQGRALVDRVTGQVKYKSKYDGMFGLEKVGKSIDLGSLLDPQYLTGTVGSMVGSVGGALLGGGGVAKALQGASAFSKSTRALNTMKNTYGAEALEAAGLYGKAASKLARGAKVEDISKNMILNYLNNDSEIRTNAEATRGEIKDELTDRAANMYSPERSSKREAILAERGITKDNPLFEMHMQNMIKEERARYIQLNPEMALNIETKAEIGSELAAQAGRMQMLTSINETAAYFTRNKLLSRAGKSANPILKSLRTKGLEAGFEGAEETIGDYSDKYGKSAILDNTFYSVADYAKNDFVTKEGLETFALGALMGVGQNTLAGAKKVATGDSDNITERVREYKEQKQALKNIQGLKTANSFDDVLKIYDQLEQQKQVTERNDQIQEALDRGDTNRAHQLKQEAFASHSLRMAKLGLTGEVEKNLQHLLKTPGIEAEPEVIREMTRAMEVNKNIGNIYDIHAQLEGGDALSSNRVSKILNQESIAKLKADLEEGNPMYQEALESFSRGKGVNFADTSEEGLKLQEAAKKEFDLEEGSVGSVVGSVKKNIEKLEEQVQNLDKAYYHSITKDYQNKLKQEKQKKLTKFIKKATTEQQVQDLLANLPKGEVPSKELTKVLLNKARKFAIEKKAKDKNNFKESFNTPVVKLEDIPEAPVQGTLDFGEEIPVVMGETFTVEELAQRAAEKPQERVPTPDGVQTEMFPEELNPEEVKARGAEILQDSVLEEEFTTGPDSTEMSDGETPDGEAVKVYNDTLVENITEDIEMTDADLDVSEQKDPIIDQESATTEQKLAQGKLKIIQEAEKNSVGTGISPGLTEDLKNLVESVTGVQEERTQASNPTSNIMDIDEVFNLNSKLNKKEEQALKLFEAFRSQFNSKNGKSPTFKDLMEVLIANSGYETAESVNGFFGQIWIDSAEDTDKAREEVREAYDTLFGLNQTINQLSLLAEDIAKSLKSDGEEVSSSTEDPRNTIPARLDVKPEPEPTLNEEAENVNPQVEENIVGEKVEEETPATPNGTKVVIDPSPGLDEVVGYTPEGTAIVSLSEESSALSPQFHFSSQEYEITGVREDGTEIIKDKYPNTNILNRGDNEDRGGHMNLDNILNPALAVTGSKLKIVPYEPGGNLPDYDKVPFLEFDEDGVRQKDVKSFQDFLDKHGLDPVKYLTPAAGPESESEEAKRKLFSDNVPMHVSVEHNGSYHQLGTILPSVNYIQKRNTFPKGNSTAEKETQQRNIEIKRRNISKQRALILSGHSEFKVTERVTKKFSTYDLDPENPKVTTEGEKMILSKAHPTEALVGIVGKYTTDSDGNPQSIVINTGKKQGVMIPLDQSHKDIVIDKESVKNFVNSSRGKNIMGWSVVLIYKNTETDAEGNVKRVYGISQTVNNSNQEVQEQANKSRLEFIKIRAYYRIKELIQDERVSPENLEAFYNEKIRAGEISDSNVRDYKNISSSEGLTANAEKIISKLKNNFGMSFMGLGLKGGLIQANKSSDVLMDGFPKTYGSTKDLTVSYTLSKKGKQMPMIDIQAGTVEDYTSPYTGRSGYDAFFQDSVGNPNKGFQIHDVTTGKDITVFSPQPIIGFAPVNIQERAAPATSSTSSVLEKKLAEKRRIEAEKAKSSEEEVSPIIPQGLSLEQQLENIIASEVKYLDENGEEC